MPEYGLEPGVVAHLLHQLTKGKAENDKHIRNIYCIGSRAYSHATDQSDHDIIVVVNAALPGRKWFNMNWLYNRGWAKRPEIDAAPALPKQGDAKKFSLSEFKRDYVFSKKDPEYNCWVYTVESFALLLEMYVPSVVECLFLPARCVGRSEVHFALPQPADVLTAYSSFNVVARAHWERARAEFGAETKEPGMKVQPEPYDSYHTRKTLFHAIRLAMFGVHLFRTGKLDLTIANDIRAGILSHQIKEGEDEFESLQKVWEPVFRATLKTLYDAASSALESQNSDCTDSGSSVRSKRKSDDASVDKVA